jgi:hypothetical protein
MFRECLRTFFSVQVIQKNVERLNINFYKYKIFIFMYAYQVQELLPARFY